MTNFNNWEKQNPSFIHLGMIDSDGGTNEFEVYWDPENEECHFWYHEELNEPVSKEFVMSLMSTEHWQEQMLNLLDFHFKQ